MSRLIKTLAPAAVFFASSLLTAGNICRRVHNSVFIDDSLYPSGIGGLFSPGVPRMKRLAVEQLVRGMEREGNLVGVRMSVVDDDSADDLWLLPPSRRLPEKVVAGPFPDSVRIVRANLLFGEKAGLPEGLLDRLNRLAAFQDPEFYKAQAMRFPTYDSRESSVVQKNFLSFWRCREACLMSCCCCSSSTAFGRSFRMSVSRARN